MEEWKKKREVWTAARDKCGVKKGAVSGVDVGGGVDKVHPAAKKGYNPLLKALESLRKDLGKYVAKIDKTSPALVDWIKKTLLPSISSLEAAAQADLDVLKDFEDKMLKFHTIYAPGIPPNGQLKDVMAAAKDDGWPAAAKKFKLYDKTAICAPKWAEFSTLVGGLKFQLELPGKKGDYDYFPARSKLYTAGSKHLAQYPGCQTMDEHFDLMKAAQNAIEPAESRATWPQLQAVLKSLRG